MFPERLEKVIADSKLKPAEFAAKVGLSESTVRRYRSGTTSPPVEFLEVVCRQFDVDPRWLIMGEEDSTLLESEQRTAACRIDTDVLTEIIAAIEEKLLDWDAKLHPGKKAELITLLYEHLAVYQGHLDKQTIERFLRIAV